MFAVHAAGGQAVLINPTYTKRELSYILRDANPVAIIYDADIAAKIEPLIEAESIRGAVQIGGNAGRRLDDWRTDNHLLLPPSPAPDDLATLQYTGGTTGLPRGVNISHRQMSINICQREAALPTRDGDESILKHPLHDAAVPRVCGRDVPASLGLLRRQGRILLDPLLEVRREIAS